MIKTNNTVLASVILLSLLISGCTADEQSRHSRAEATAEGRAAYEAGDYQTAYEELHPLAEEGDPLSQYYIARMYHFGEGRKEDIDKAIKWYGRSAEAGAAPAQYRLGRIYDVEDGYKDTDRAIDWYLKAAEGGNVDAMHSLGYVYAENGELKHAFRWKKKAADSGSAAAQFDVGLQYEKGVGTAINPDQALAYYDRAARQGYGRAMINLAFIYSEGKGVDRDLRHVYKWFLLAREQGMRRAGLELEELERRLDEKSLSEARAMADVWRQTYLKQ